MKQYADQASALLDDLKKANTRLKESFALPFTQIHRDAAIKRFEFTFELAWKLMQATVRYLGTDMFGPRESIRAAARYDLITEPEEWMNLLDARNLTVHVYKEVMADDVYDKAKHLPSLVDRLLEQVGKRLAEEKA